MTEKMVEIELELDEREFIFAATQAHEQDITLNQYINNLLERFIKEETDRNG